MAIKKKYVVEKRNVLNEIRSNNMTLQELRFFSIYLAKINARDASTRVVRFTRSEFMKIMEIDFMKMSYLKYVTTSLLCKIVNIPLETGGYKAFQLFKVCTVDKDKNGEWYVEIDAHDESLPLMFEFKEKYFSYELWNALRLKSTNQLRMYEILKQYENTGERIISIQELKELLGLNASDYLRYDNFRARVLDICQKALEMSTDIKFTYEPTGKKGKGGKIHTLKFNISHNENHVDPLSLENFIDMQDTHLYGTDDSPTEIVFTNEKLSFLAQACNKEFNEAEMTLLYNYLIEICPYMLSENKYERETKLYDLLKTQYDELNWRAERTEISDRFLYLKKMIESKMNKL